MAEQDTRSQQVDAFIDAVRGARQRHAAAGGRIAVSRAPAVADVMGGIGEDSGALVLTRTLPLSVYMAAWTTPDRSIRLLRAASPRDATTGAIDLPVGVLTGADANGNTRDLTDLCRNGNYDWAIPIGLAIRHAFTAGRLPPLDSGLVLLVQSDLPAECDHGRLAVQATAAIDALARLADQKLDPLEQARLAADAITALTGVSCLRTALTAICGSDDGALLQIRFHPKIQWEALALPAEIDIVGARTTLSRPTTPERLLEARICAEMGHRMIRELQRHDGMTRDPNGGRLAAITPTEYVEHFRDRLPAKITGGVFTERFGSLRRLDGELEPRTPYKIRSRSEHQIYENRRVHEFAGSLARARRSGDLAALVRAGELMYASHWSHSQRCGIGGVETDRFASAIRRRGPDAGLFGAKVTGAGAGGEMVVLMRNDETARTALAEAVAEAEAASGRPIQTWTGALRGTAAYQPPALDDLVTSGVAS